MHSLNFDHQPTPLEVALEILLFQQLEKEFHPSLPEHAE
jgi:hypothetical protein